MHRLWLGCNIWNALFLVAAAWMGWAGSPHHVRVSIFTAVFTCLVQCGIIALFLGAAKLTKEHVGRFNMPLRLIDQLNSVYHRLIPMAAVGATWVAAAAIAGGLSHVGGIPLWIHSLLATGAFLYLIAIIIPEYRLLSKMHDVISQVEGLLPAQGSAGPVLPHPGYHPDRIVLDRAGRAKALLYLGLSLPLPYLGYTYISGHDISYLLIPTAVSTLLCLAGAAHQFAASRRRHQG